MKLKKYIKQNKILLSIITLLILIMFIYSNNYVLSTQYATGALRSSPELAKSIAFDSVTNDKIEKTSTMYIESNTYNVDIKNINKIYEKYNGYSTYSREESATSNNEKIKHYYISFKIPSTNFNDAIEDIKKIGTSKSIEINSQDRTNEYEDLNSYLTNYEKEKDNILLLLGKADKVEDLITIQNRLSKIQRQIDYYTIRIKNLNLTTEYNTINVYLYENPSVFSPLYKLTGVKELFANIINSFNLIIVTFTKLFGWISISLIIWLIYKYKYK